VSLRYAEQGLAAATEAFAALALFGCAAQARHASAALPSSPRTVVTAASAAPAGAEALTTPPPAAALPQITFPAIRHAVLDDGMALRVVTRKDFPIVELRLVVSAGSASDGDRPGLSALTGELLKEGGAGPYSAEQLAERAESLGASIDVSTGRDATSIGLGVTSADIERALGLLADVALSPRFAPSEFAKLKQREVERVKNSARGNADWAASMVLYRQLFATASGVHPYAHYDATASELAELTLADCRNWYGRYFTPANALLVVAGDVDPFLIEEAANHAFAAWRGARPAPLAYPAPARPLEPVVWLVDRPHAGQSQLDVATLGPERSSPSWPALAAADQILGGGVASRLFVDVREKRSLAYHTGSSAEEPAHGPVPLVLSAGTQTAKTAAALDALLDNLRRLSDAPPAPWEVQMATTSLSDELLFRTERLGALAEATSKLAILGLPDDYFSGFRRDLERLEPASVFAVARRYYGTTDPVMVVAGDAAVIAEPLRRFGNVEVVDPDRDFVTLRELPRQAH
jgi:predicted Zn-dependent peptidase